MSRDIFGMTPESFQKRIGAEKNRADKLRKAVTELLDAIKYTSEEDGWQRVVIFSNTSATLNGLSYLERSSVLYYLRRHPNIISKLSDKEKRIGGLESMKPYLFKWVSTEEKEELGAGANYFRNLSSELIEKVKSECPDKSAGFLVDVFSILEFFLGKKKRDWIETSTHNISSFSGVPIENTRAALNVLLKLKLLVIAYLPCEGNRMRLKMNVYVTLTEEERSQAISEKWLDAAQMITEKDALDQSFEFTVVDYFYTGAGKVNEENTDKSTEVSLNLEENSAGEKVAETKSSLSAPINIIMPELPGLNQTLDDIKSCVVSFTQIAESMYKNETQRNELLNNIVQTSTKQREEYDDLYNQMVAMKKILNQKDRDKDKFVKAIQDALNMMMGKIISETDEFSKIPRHLLDEQKLQAHKAEIIQITVQTAEEIRRLAAY